MHAHPLSGGGACLILPLRARGTDLAGSVLCVTSAHLCVGV